MKKLTGSSVGFFVFLGFFVGFFVGLRVGIFQFYEEVRGET